MMAFYVNEKGDAMQANSPEQIPKDYSKLEKWSSSYIKGLPDSSFAFIESGGERHLPYKDATGKVDLSHLRNAIARSAQIKLKNGQMIPEQAAQKIQSRLQRVLASHEAKDQMDMEDMDEKLKSKKKKKVKHMMGKYAEEGLKSPAIVQRILYALNEATKGKKDSDKVEITGIAIKGLMEDLNSILTEMKEVENDLKFDGEEEPAPTPQPEPLLTPAPTVPSPEPAKAPDEQPKAETPAAPAESKTEEPAPVPAAEPNPEIAKAENPSPLEADEEETKLAQAIDLAEKFKKQLDESITLNQKLTSQVAKLETEKKQLYDEVSKMQATENRIKQEKYDQLFDNTLDKYAKFHNFDDKSKQAKKQEWQVSKMSEAALAEIVSMVEEASKLEEPATEPSEYLDGGASEGTQESPKEAFAKLSKEEQLKALSSAGAEALRRKAKN